MNKIDSRTDWLLEQCWYRCFVCGTEFAKPPEVTRGQLDRCIIFNIIDEWGDKVETEERCCQRCWVSDLSRFADKD